MASMKVFEWSSEAAMAAEYRTELGDKRRNRRAESLGVAIAMKPELSFPKLFPDEAELEANYRLIRNPAIGWRELHEGHRQRSYERAAAADTVAVVHDTTDVTFAMYWRGQLRSEMSKFTSGSQGFFAHLSLAISASRARPLGVLEIQPFVHQKGVLGDDDARAFWEGEQGLFANEHERWFRGIERSGTELAARGVSPVHLMDCETDSYGLLSWMVEQKHRFVVRGDGTRKIEHLDEMREVGTLEVELTERGDLRRESDQQSNPARAGRKTCLAVRAGVVRLMRARNIRDRSWSPGGPEHQPPTLELNLVEVIETSAPPGEKPVRWLLYTTEPIETEQQVLQVVELYRRRWLIEEYFKALKTGCRLESRQMESASTMLAVLALLAPAAWRLLLLRTLVSENPEGSWSLFFQPIEFKLLQRVVPKAKLTETATLHQCLYALAKLGGHLPRNGPPGWQTLHSGLEELTRLVTGALLARDVINP